MRPIWSGNITGASRRGWNVLLGRGMSGITCLSCHNDLITDKQEIIDGSLNDQYADRDSFRVT